MESWRRLLCVSTFAVTFATRVGWGPNGVDALISAPEMVMVRTYNPTDLMIERMSRVIEDNPGREVVIAVDTTDAATKLEAGTNHSTLLSPSEEKLKLLVQKFPGRVFTYDNDAVLAHFPEMAQLGGSRKIGMRFHDECIYTVLKSWEKAHGEPWKGSVWAIEDDVEFTAPWNRLFDAYAGAEYVSAGIHQLRSAVSDEKMAQLSEEFKARYISADFHWNFAYEHVVKFGESFLARVHAELQQGVHARSEFSTPSMAAKWNVSASQLDRLASKWWCHGQNHCCGDECLAYVKVSGSQEEGLLFHPVKA